LAGLPEVDHAFQAREEADEQGEDGRLDDGDGPALVGQTGGVGTQLACHVGDEGHERGGRRSVLRGRTRLPGLRCNA
jgi:hypothetical protein